MPAIAQIQLADGQTTPVTHNFDPKTTNGSLARWVDTSETIPQGFSTLSINYVEPANNAAAHRFLVEIRDPTVVSVNGVDTVVYVNSCKLEFNFSTSSSLQSRKDAFAYVKNLMANATFNTAVTTIQPYY